MQRTRFLVSTAASPQRQPTDRKENNLDRIEHTLYNCFTGNAPLPSCSLSPNSIPPGASSTLSTLTVTTGEIAASAEVPLSRSGRLFASLLPVTWISGMLIAGSGKRTQKRWALICVILFAAVPSVSCGGSSGPPPPAGQTYAVTVTATSGALMHTTTVSLTVQ
jgi:hypothetical protein